MYDGHVHPKVLMPGVFIILFAAWILHLFAHSGGGNSILINFAYYLATHYPSTVGFYKMLTDWQAQSPDVAPEVKIVVLGIALYGFSRMMRGVVLMQSTELVVTDRRIIAKYGLMTVITIEMDKRRVAAVSIDQTLLGRIMGYGHIFIQGFTSSIGGLPVMVNPRLVEQFVTANG
jgi:hypothetical protein